MARESIELSFDASNGATSVLQGDYHHDTYVNVSPYTPHAPEDDNDEDDDLPIATERGGVSPYLEEHAGFHKDMAEDTPPHLIVAGVDCVKYLFSSVLGLFRPRRRHVRKF